MLDKKLPINKIIETSYHLLLTNNLNIALIITSNLGEIGLLLPTRFIKIVSKICNYHSLTMLKQLSDIIATEFIITHSRFCITYFLNSVQNAMAVRFRIHTYKGKLMSLSLLFKSSSWLEREIYDLFGIFFLGHLELKRILTDYGFEGSPLRKEFPIFGLVDIVYNDDQKRIEHPSISLTQEWRIFKLKDSWKTRSVL
jgi:NADH-quinone oxidoreductase subunit C